MRFNKMKVSGDLEKMVSLGRWVQSSNYIGSGENGGEEMGTFIVLTIMVFCFIGRQDGDD
jgi:hypothetical protein